MYTKEASNWNYDTNLGPLAVWFPLTLAYLSTIIYAYKTDNVSSWNLTEISFPGEDRTFHSSYN